MCITNGWKNNNNSYPFTIYKTLKWSITTFHRLKITIYLCVYIKKKIIIELLLTTTKVQTCWTIIIQITKPTILTIILMLIQKLYNK